MKCTRFAKWLPNDAHPEKGKVEISIETDDCSFKNYPYGIILVRSQLITRKALLKQPLKKQRKEKLGTDGKLRIRSAIWGFEKSLNLTVPVVTSRAVEKQLSPATGILSPAMNRPLEFAVQLVSQTRIRDICSSSYQK